MIGTAGAAAELLALNWEEVVLQQFSADSTPIRARCGVTVRGTKFKVHTTGVRKHELLVQHCSYSVLDEHDCVQSVILFREPQRMEFGK
eukprot:5787277-Amphidinium_carterae.1